MTESFGSHVCSKFFGTLFIIGLCGKPVEIEALDAYFTGRSSLQYNVGAEQINELARTPPMGWMSWSQFYCETNCTSHPDSCVSEDLYGSMTDALVSGGYLEAGYDTISIDDCWMETYRDEETKRQVPDSSRFPSGMKNLGDYMHTLGVHLGLYTDMGAKTCAGFAGSMNFETIDADAYAEWGVDYLKVDGCYNSQNGFADGYPKLGKALRSTGRNITYSCSWPAYLGNDESIKPFQKFIDAGCNLWRNWSDINNSWSSIATIIDYFGNYSAILSTVAGPGHWNDMDMIVVGNSNGGSYLSPDQCMTQMSIWSIMASPLIMSNDLRQMPKVYADILLNREVIAVNQDPLGRAGLRAMRHPNGGEVWIRQVSNERMAIVLYNRNEDGNALSLQANLRDISVKLFNTFKYWEVVTARDLWTGKNLGIFGEVISAVVRPTACKFLVIAEHKTKPHLEKRQD